MAAIFDHNGGHLKFKIALMLIILFSNAPTTVLNYKYVFQTGLQYFSILQDYSIAIKMFPNVCNMEHSHCQSTVHENAL